MKNEFINRQMIERHNQRIDYIDVMKGLAIFYVVIGHVLAWAYNDWYSATQHNFVGVIAWKIIYSFHMPLFMFVSGYVVFNPQKKYCIKDVSKRIIQYIIPFISVGTILFYYRDDPSGICNYWYLRALAEYVIVLYIVERLFVNFVIPEKIKCIIVVLLFIICFIILNHIIVEGSIYDIIFCKKHLNL